MTWMIWGYPYCRKPLVDHDMEEHHIILEPPWRVDVDPFIGILVRRLFGRTKDPVSRLPLEFLSTWSSLQIQVAAVRSVFSSQNFKTPTIESIFWGVPNEKKPPQIIQSAGKPTSPRLLELGIQRHREDCSALFTPAVPIPCGKNWSTGSLLGRVFSSQITGELLANCRQRLNAMPKIG
jgi:hypothetical protein